MKGNTPLFTIVTVTFNAATVIERTLLSVERQSCDSVEHIIVDGRSTDNTMQLVRLYAERNRRHSVRTLCEPDRGLYDAMNKGIALATGKYTLFLNAGDALHYHTDLDEVARKMQGREYSVVYGETDIVDDGGKFLYSRRLKAPAVFTSQSFQDGMLVCHQSMHVLTSIAKETPYDLSYRYSADFDWVIRVLERGESLGLATLNTEMILTDYLRGGLTTRHHCASLLERLRIMAKHYGRAVAIRKHLWFVLRAIINP